MIKNIFENGVKITQIQSSGMKLSYLRVNWLEIKELISLEIYLKFWISLTNEIRRINKFMDLIKL